jgi:glutamyl-tRNA synthetase
LERLAPWLSERYGAVDQSKVGAVLGAIRPRSKTLLEAAESLGWLLAEELTYDDKAKKKFLLSERAAPLAPLREVLAAIDDFSAAPLEDAVKSWAEAQELKLGAVAQPARVALTGRTFSPGLFDVMEILGREKTLARLDKAIALSAEA